MNCAAVVLKLMLWVLIALQWTVKGDQRQTKGPPVVLSSLHQRRQMARVGDRLRLECPVESQPHEAIYEWRKDGREIHFGWHRFRIRYGTLHLRDLELDDTGVYTCTAVNGFGTAEFRYLVYVSPDVNRTLAPPGEFDENSFLDRRSSAEAPVFLHLDHMIRESHVTQPTGSTVRLRCRASGRPRPEVIWFKDGKRIPDEEHDDKEEEEEGSPQGGGEGSGGAWQLRLVKVKVEDSGRYSCRAVNKAGMVSFIYDVDIIPDNSNPDPVFLSPLPSNMTVAEGQQATLECHIQTSMQDPHIQWLKKLDRQFRANDDIHWSVTNNSTVTFIGGEPYALMRRSYITTAGHAVDGHYSSRLVIRSASSVDTGQYACSTMTSKGLSYRTASLTVIPPTSVTGRSESLMTSLIVVVIIIITISMVTALLFIAVTCFVRRRRIKYRGTQKHGTPLIGSLLPVPPPPPPPPSTKIISPVRGGNHYEHHYAALDSNPSSTITTVRPITGCAYRPEPEVTGRRCAARSSLVGQWSASGPGNYQMDFSETEKIEVA